MRYILRCGGLGSLRLHQKPMSLLQGPERLCWGCWSMERSHVYRAILGRRCDSIFITYGSMAPPNMRGDGNLQLSRGCDITLRALSLLPATLTQPTRIGVPKN